MIIFSAKCEKRFLRGKPEGTSSPGPHKDGNVTIINQILKDIPDEHLTVSFRGLV